MTAEPDKGDLFYQIVSLLNVDEVTRTMVDVYGLNTLEYVQAIISLTHKRRGDVQIELICPSGTKSLIGATRKLDEYVFFYCWRF